MSESASAGAESGRARFIELYTPKLITILRDGYGLRDLRADIAAGLTVAIVALPLSMAIAIASGTSPERGLYTAIVGGFLISALGGSRFQIGGPAGAFIVLVAATVQRHGIDGMLLATGMAGVIMLAMGLLRLGTYIKFIPYPVTVGFTAGIAVIIFASQIRELLGLTLSGREPGEIVPKLQALAGALPTVNAYAVGVGLFTLAAIPGIKRLWPRLPNLLIAVTAATLASAFLHLPVETIASRFGGIPSSLPLPALPPISGELVMAVLPDAIAFALLGAIESLLSAVVADGMTGRQHRSNCELVAQGLANIGAALFGGICATGTIARTATNVRAGARGPVSGMLHAVFLLLFMLLAAPLAGHIPLAALAGVLAYVAWNMVERHAIRVLAAAAGGDALVLAVTFLLTVFRDLTEAIVVGVALGALVFMRRITAAASVEVERPTAGEDRADGPAGSRTAYDSTPATDRDVVVFRISGAFFFGSVSSIGAVLDRIAKPPKAYVLDFAAVAFLDSTAAKMIESFALRCRNRGIELYVTGAGAGIRRELLRHGTGRAVAHYVPTVADAIARIRRGEGKAEH